MIYFAHRVEIGWYNLRPVYFINLGNWSTINTQTKGRCTNTLTLTSLFLVGVFAIMMGIFFSIGVAYVLEQL